MMNEWRYRSPRKLTIGEVFKHDDPVGHWMFSVTALAEDLMVGSNGWLESLAETQKLHDSA